MASFQQTLQPIAILSIAGLTSRLDSRLSGTIWEDKLDLLETAIVRCAATKPVAALCEWLRKRHDTPDAVGRLLSLLSLLPDAPRTKTRMALKVEVSVKTLDRQWRKEVTRQADPLDLVDWSLLLSWTHLAPSMTLDEGALALLVDPRTLDRVAKRWLEKTARAAAKDPERTRVAFERWVREAF